MRTPPNLTRLELEVEGPQGIDALLTIDVVSGDHPRLRVSVAGNHLTLANLGPGMATVVSPASASPIHLRRLDTATLIYGVPHSTSAIEDPHD